MIEKLSEYKITSRDGSFINVECNTKIINTLVRKINNLVDAVNVLQAQVAILEEHAHPTATTKPAAPYAEQRKWIGKLCKFWDIDNNNLYYGPLTKIHYTSPYCYECNHKMCYAFCEPVSEDLIYKGGDNE